MKYFFILMIFGCTSIKTINLQKHSFNDVPKNIIWLQIAGLSPEHLALVRFDDRADSAGSELEKSTCMGNMWTYNSYKLRPTPSESFLTQLTGKTNINNTCEDFSNKPLWHYLNDRGFKTGVLEVGANSDETLDRAFECQEGNDFKNIIFFSMSKDVKGGFKKLDLLDSTPFKLGNKYHISCEVCEQNLFPTMTSIMERFENGKDYNLFILRDFSYLKYLKNGDFKNAKYFLEGLSKIYKTLKERKETLLLLTSSSMAKIDLPPAGAQWFEFEKSGKNAPYKADSLLSFVMADGSGSEKFCGIYSESDLLERILIDPRKKFKQFLFW